MSTFFLRRVINFFYFQTKIVQVIRIKFRVKLNETTTENFLTFAHEKIFPGGGQNYFGKIENLSSMIAKS